MTHLATLLVMLTGGSFAQATLWPGARCVQILNQELQALGMGTFDDLAPGVSRTENFGHHGLDFVRNHKGQAQVVGMTDFLTITNLIYVADTANTPNSIRDKKISVYNDCSIQAVQFSYEGSEHRLTPRICLSAVDQTEMTAKWLQSRSLIEIVKKQCDSYKEYWHQGPLP